MSNLRHETTSALDALWQQHRSLVEGPFRAVAQETRHFDESQMLHVQDALDALAETISSGENSTTQSVARAVRETLLMLGPQVRNQCPSLDKGLHAILEAVLSPSTQLTLDEVVCAVSALRTSLRE